MGRRPPTLERGRMPSRYRPKPSQAVLDARAKRGRHLNVKIDTCGCCLHWLPLNERCSIDQHWTTATGSCALHDRAASEVERHFARSRARAAARNERA